MRETLLFALLVFCVAELTASPAELKVELANGRATVVARDVSLRQILEEWARIGNTRIVNADRVSTLPMTIELRGVPEQQALDVLLRAVAGYLAAPRRAGDGGVSLYDRVVILPSSTAPAAASATAPRQPLPAADRGAPGAQPVPAPESDAGAADLVVIGSGPQIAEPASRRSPGPISPVMPPGTPRAAIGESQSRRAAPAASTVRAPNPASVPAPAGRIGTDDPRAATEPPARTSPYPYSPEAPPPDEQ